MQRLADTVVVPTLKEAASIIEAAPNDAVVEGRQFHINPQGTVWASQDTIVYVAGTGAASVLVAGDWAEGMIKVGHIRPWQDVQNITATCKKHQRPAHPDYLVFKVLSMSNLFKAQLLLFTLFVDSCVFASLLACFMVCCFVYYVTA